jgi:hypothetical protein
MKYQKPIFEKIQTTNLCSYGCSQIAQYKFRCGKLCCSKHFNSCPGKRLEFSNRTDHKDRNAKSLATRVRLGITKSSQIKAGKTRKKNGHYKKLAEIMRVHWATDPWNNNLQMPLLEYKDTNVIYQGSFEHSFLESLENEHSLTWIKDNVSRGPNIWYVDPNDKIRKLYISDFIIENTIFEIKSSWTWDKNGTDEKLRIKNKAKLDECIRQGYNVILVLNGQRIEYVKQ